MASKKNDVDWKKFKRKVKQIQDTYVSKLKTKNDELDQLMCNLYPHFKCKNALGFYKSLAGHIDNNNEWYKKMTKFNTEAQYIKVRKG